MSQPTMTSRERVLKTLNHEEPDRVPFNLALTIDIYNRLRKYLNLPAEPDKAMGYWTNVSPSLDLLDAMQVDILTVGLNPPSNPQNLDRGDGLLYDEWGIGRDKIERIDGSYYYEMVYHPLAGATLEDVANYPWPDPYDPGRVEGLREKVLDYRNNTDKAILAKFSNSIWEQAWWLYGMESWLTDLVLNPEVPLAIMAKLADIAIGFADVGLDAIGDLADIYRLSGEDLGTQLAPQISPAMFNDLVKPHFGRYWDFAKTKHLKMNPNGKLMIHSCGNIRALIPTWIEMGLDVLDPVQPRVVGMDPAPLKQDFGNDLVFHGGIDLQQVLPFGTREEVMAEVKIYIEALASGGGYIVAPAHNVQSDVPAENLVAIRDAVQEYGYY